MTQLDLFNISVNGYGKMQIDEKYPETPGYKEHTTSKEAAIRVRESANIVRGKLIGLYSSGFVGTADEASKELFGEDDKALFTVRPRATELRAQGVLRRTGAIREGKHVLEIGK